MRLELFVINSAESLCFISRTKIRVAHNIYWNKEIIYKTDENILTVNINSWCLKKLKVHTLQNAGTSRFKIAESLRNFWCYVVVYFH